MADRKAKDVLSDKAGEFMQSDLWKVVKYRLSIVLAKRLNEKVISSIRQGDQKTAVKYCGMMDGVEEAIRATEHLSSEIGNGKLDVDAALGVIIKKSKKPKRRPKWLRKLQELLSKK